MGMRSDKETYCSKVYSKKQHRCWECQSLAKRNIQKKIVDKNSDKYIANDVHHNWTEVVKEEMFTRESNGRTGVKQWVWDYNYVMPFGHFCTATCAMVYANKAVLKSRKLLKSSRDTLTNLDKAKDRLASKFNTNE